MTGGARPEREAGLGVDRLAIGAMNLLEQRGHAHLVEDRDAVVGAAAVGAEADAHATRDLRSTGSVTPSPQGTCSSRAVGEAAVDARQATSRSAASNQQAGGPRSFDADRPGRSATAASRLLAETLERLHRPGSAPRRWVDVPRHAGVSAAQPAPASIIVRRGAVLTVRRGLDRDDEVAVRIAILFVQRLVVATAMPGTVSRYCSPARRPSRRNGARARSVSTIRAGARPRSSPTRASLPLRVDVVEVADGRDAVEQHLAEREQRGGRHVVRGEPWRIAIQRAVAPGQEWQVIADAAQRRLEAMVVRVDGAGTIARWLQSIRRAPGASTSAGSPTAMINPSSASTLVGPRAPSPVSARSAVMMIALKRLRRSTRG